MCQEPADALRHRPVINHKGIIISVILQTVKLAGFTSAGVPATGAGLIASTTINRWDNGSITFSNAAGVTKKIENTPELNALLQLLIVGTGGISTTANLII